MNRYMQFVNSTMSEINSLCDELYEALADNEIEQSIDVSKRLIKAVREIQKLKESIDIYT